MLTIAAFVFALAILIGVHEWGHYCMAVMSGVKVLRFSIGFGPRLWGWTSVRTGTDFVLCALPLGGYVKMLDGREGAVDPAESHRAFNTQSLRVRSAIVAAGPVANLILAILLYAAVNWADSTQLDAVLPRPLVHSAAAQAGFVGGEQVMSVAIEGEPLKPVRSFEDFRWELIQAALSKKNLVIEFRQSGVDKASSVLLNRRTLDLSALDARVADASLFRAIGWQGPLSAALVGEVMPDGAAAKAGLKTGDLVSQVDGVDIADGAQLRELIRSAGAAGPAVVQRWQLLREGNPLQLLVTPQSEEVAGQVIGRINAMVGAPPSTILVRYGAWDALVRALVRTWEVSWLTLKMMGQIVTGAASLHNLSGPITIADYAGKSAAMGLTQYVVFLALISISLGVLNLLPIPVLDGGHLMYYLWESLTGRPVSEIWMGYLQRVGVGLLMGMMSIAVFNDMTQLWR